MSLQAQGDPVYAIGCFTKAVSPNRAYREVNSNQSAALLETGDSDGAISPSPRP